MKRKIDSALFLIVLVLFVFGAGVFAARAQEVDSGIYPADAAQPKTENAAAAEEKPQANATSAAPASAKTDAFASQPVELNGDNVEYKADEGKFVASGNVVLKQNNSTLFCDKLEFFRDKQEAHAEGHVVVISDQGTVWADEAFYNFGIKKGEFTNARIMAHPIFGQAQTISKINENYYVLSNGYLTTSDYDTPEWRVRSRHIEVFPGQKAVAHDSTMFLGPVPVMYFPKYTQDLRDNRPHIRVTPGFSKKWGMSLLTAYRVYPVDGIGLTYHVDYREKKDIASGVDLEYAPGKLGQGLVRTYYMNERTLTKHIWDKRTTPTVERERYRVEWRHRVDIDPQTNFIGQYYKLSDSTILKDYFEKEYREDQVPSTYFLLTRTMANSSMSLRVDKRVNRFESTVERLPEVNYTLNNQQIGDSGFYFKSNNTASNLVKKGASPSDASDRTFRFDTDNEVSRPFKAGFVELRPYVGTEQTYYSRTVNPEDENSVRGIFRTGVDASTKFYRLYDVSFNKWGIEVNRLRHVITPTVSYIFQNDPTMPTSKFYQFDSIDARERSDKVALGIENKLQTKRKGQAVDIFRSLLTADYRLEDDPNRGGIGDIILDDEFYPNQYLTFSHDLTYDNQAGNLKSANFDMYIKDNKRWEFDISRRYTRDDDDLITTQLSYTFNPKWRTVVYDRWNVDNGDWEEQQYSLIRDLHSWEMELAFRDKNKYEDSGSEVWVIFRLKAFPSVGLSGTSGFNKSKTGSRTN